VARARPAIVSTSTPEPTDMDGSAG
jgi:hypothetical protein